MFWFIEDILFLFVRFSFSILSCLWKFPSMRWCFISFHTTKCVNITWIFECIFCSYSSVFFCFPKFIYCMFNSRVLFMHFTAFPLVSTKKNCNSFFVCACVLLLGWLVGLHLLCLRHCCLWHIFRCFLFYISVLFFSSFRSKTTKTNIFFRAFVNLCVSSSFFTSDKMKWEITAITTVTGTAEAAAHAYKSYMR